MVVADTNAFLRWPESLNFLYSIHHRWNLDILPSCYEKIRKSSLTCENPWRAMKILQNMARKRLSRTSLRFVCFPSPFCLMLTRHQPRNLGGQAWSCAILFIGDQFRNEKLSLQELMAAIRNSTLFSLKFANIHWRGVAFMINKGSSQMDKLDFCTSSSRPEILKRTNTVLVDESTRARIFVASDKSTDGHISAASWRWVRPQHLHPLRDQPMFRRLAPLHRDRLLWPITVISTIGPG